MSSLAFLLLGLAGDAVPAAPAVPKPKVALFARSVLTEANTMSFSKAVKAGREKTCSLIEMQVWHHGAQASTNSSFFCARACASALG